MKQVAIFTPVNFIFKLVLAFEEFVEIVAVDGLSIGSTAGIPTKVNKSANIADFNRTSNGLSHPNEGDKFISSNHGFKVSSTNISKPYNSKRNPTKMIYNFTHLALNLPKQLLGLGTNILQAETIEFPEHNIDFTTKSSTCDIK